MRTSMYLVVAGAISLAACARSSNKTVQPAPSSTASSVDAGGSGGARGGRGGRREEMLLRGITLSDAQRVQIDSIRVRYRAQMEANRSQNGGGAPDPARREQMMDMMQRQSAEIRAVLTDEQKAQFDKNLEDMRARGGRRGDGGGRPPR